MNTPTRHAEVTTIALVLLLANAAVARGQEGIAGSQPNRAYASQLPFEQIDPLSGNLMLQFTDLVLPGNAGRDLRFQRTFNRKRSTNPVLKGCTRSGTLRVGGVR
jgi:hypothetical protein